MPTLSAFLNVSLDGYYVDGEGDMSWAHKSTADAEWQAFVEGNAKVENALVFGRVTYDVMAGFWPTPMATTQNPVVAARMNATPKIVFSRTLRDASWNNTTLVSDDMLTSMRALKAGSGPNMTILGSGNVVGQLLGAGLIDELHLAIAPALLGSGENLFAGIDMVRLGYKVTEHVATSAATHLVLGKA